jgi:hypothetical protein
MVRVAGTLNQGVTRKPISRASRQVVYPLAAVASHRRRVRSASQVGAACWPLVSAGVNWRPLRQRAHLPPHGLAQAAC